MKPVAPYRPLFGVKAKLPEFRLRPDGKGWLARVVVGGEQVTGAWSSCPWDALARAAGYMRHRARLPGPEPFVPRPYGIVPVYRRLRRVTG